MIGKGVRHTILFGKNYMWVRDEAGKLRLMRITPEALFEALEEGLATVKQQEVTA